MPVLLPEERIGSMIAGKYRVDGIIGRGGMGVVFAGHHEWTGRQVAVKVLNPELVGNEDAVRRFLQEARAAAQLHSPYVVDVLDMGDEGDRTVYMVLELLRGESLGDRLEREGTLSPGATMAVLGPIMEALGDAHDQGIVHRDIKPDNIFLSLDPHGKVVPKLLDFGVAKVAQASRNTKTGTMMGTPHYMSPEQVRGDSDTGAPADIWSMGVLFYECLSGQVPYPGESTTGVLTSILIHPPRPLDEAAPALPPSIVRAVMAALQADPRDRPPTMRSFRKVMRRVMSAAGVEEVLPEVEESASERTGPIRLPSESGAFAPTEVGESPFESQPPPPGSRTSTPVGTPYAPEPSSGASVIVPPSRAPLFIGAAAAACLVIGGGGMALWLGSASGDSVEGPPAVAEPAAAPPADEPTEALGATGGAEPTEGVDPPPADPPVAAAAPSHVVPAPAPEPAAAPEPPARRVTPRVRARPVAIERAPEPVEPPPRPAPREPPAPPAPSVGANDAPILDL